MAVLPDVEPPLPDLPVQVGLDLRRADVLLLDQLGHLAQDTSEESFKKRKCLDERKLGQFYL